MKWKQIPFVLQSTIAKLTLQSKDYGFGCNIFDSLNFNCSQHIYLTLYMNQNVTEGSFNMAEVKEKQSG